MLYSCTHMSTVSVKGLTFGRPPLKRVPKEANSLFIENWTRADFAIVNFVSDEYLNI